MAQKTRHEQQIVPKSSPIGQGFLGSRTVRKGWGTKRFDQKKKVQGGLGQKWYGPKVVRKTNKNIEKTIFKKESLFPSPKTKNVKTQKRKKTPKSNKWENSSPPRPKNKKFKKSTTKSKN